MYIDNVRTLAACGNEQRSRTSTTIRKEEKKGKKAFSHYFHVQRTHSSLVIGEEEEEVQQ